jgi:predicted DCC family thiol-disulfide oxidoreductase YuxK
VTVDTDPPPAASDPGPIVFFDGVCNLCNASVRFVIRRDPRAVFRFAALDSAAANRRLSGRKDLPDSMVLLEEGHVWTRSTAALRIARRLRFPWPLAYAFIVVPRPVRDWIYAVVARNRYRWFGRRDRCELPTPALRARFLD